MKWQSHFLVHCTLLGLAYSWRENITLKSLNSILFVCLLYEYLHVGCAMRNKKCHMDFSSFYPTTKLAIGCKYLLEVVNLHEEGTT